MKELNKFRQFLNEGVLDKAMFKAKKFVDLQTPLDFEKGKEMLEKGVDELRDIVQAMSYQTRTEPNKSKRVQRRKDAGFIAVDNALADLELAIYKLDAYAFESKNDAVLDEIINEAKPNLKKALPKIAARNVERNNLINADIEDMMDMVGEAGKGEKSEEAQILFKASNASAELEGALTDLQMYFEDDLDEIKEK